MRLPEKVPGFCFAALLLPQADKCGFVATHDDASIGAADERSAKVAEFGSGYSRRLISHDPNFSTIRLLIN